MHIFYQSEIIAPKNSNSYIAVNECLFSHKNGHQFWMIGDINTQAKEFMLEASLDRSEATLKKFILKYIEKGNSIITDVWEGYNFLNNIPPYNHITHIHIGRNFSFGIQSTSHIESLWVINKAKIKSSYKVIININLMKFVKEDEFKYFLRNRTYEDKIIALFDSFKLIKNVSDAEFWKN